MITAIEATPLTVGTKAPAFSLAASGVEGIVSLSDYAGKNLIIVFYPKDSTPGCTRQLCALRDDVDRFAKLNTAILGSNPGSITSHTSFSQKQGYPFPILVDADRTMARDYGALKENGTSIQRTVYIIDGTGVIRFAQQGMPTDDALEAAIKTFA
ncbi:MAG: peroxiredoxin [Vampirovibrionales bacterium]|nr:peroxiredoxin [Vampirovibrionales bacterium]